MSTNRTVYTVGQYAIYNPFESSTLEVKVSFFIPIPPNVSMVLSVTVDHLVERRLQVTPPLPSNGGATLPFREGFLLDPCYEKRIHNVVPAIRFYDEAGLYQSV